MKTVIETEFGNITVRESDDRLTVCFEGANPEETWLIVNGKECTLKWAYAAMNIFNKPHKPKK